jgi:hypothetical protein
VLRAGGSGVGVPMGAGNFSPAPALRPTQPPVQYVPRVLSLGVERPRREADHSPPSSAEIKE